MGFPRDAKEQEDVAPHGVELKDALGNSGTIVYMPDCDRLSSATAKTLVEDATKTFGHVYRRKISKGLRIYVNNRLVEAYDPTFQCRRPAIRAIRQSRRPVYKTSRLVTTRVIALPSAVGPLGSYNMTIKSFALPIREWKFSRKVLTEIGVTNDQHISILRNDREVFAGHYL